MSSCVEAVWLHGGVKPEDVWTGGVYACDVRSGAWACGQAVWTGIAGYHRE